MLIPSPSVYPLSVSRGFLTDLLSAGKVAAGSLKGKMIDVGALTVPTASGSAKYTLSEAVGLIKHGGSASNGVVERLMTAAKGGNKEAISTLQSIATSFDSETTLLTGTAKSTIEDLASGTLQLGEGTSFGGEISKATSGISSKFSKLLSGGTSS